MEQESGNSREELAQRVGVTGGMPCSGMGSKGKARSGARNPACHSYLLGKRLAVAVHSWGSSRVGFDFGPLDDVLMGNLCPNGDSTTHRPGDMLT